MRAKRALALLAHAAVFLAGRHSKFNNWYPNYAGAIENTLEGTCDALVCNPNVNCSNILAAYKAAGSRVDARDGCYNGTSHVSTACTARSANPVVTVYDCISSGLPPNEVSNFESADVLLGLTPTLLLGFAQSIGDLSLLSTRRPVLALLVSLGAPAVNVPRLFAYTNPLQSLIGAPTVLAESFLGLESWRVSCASVLQYAIALCCNRQRCSSLLAAGTPKCDVLEVPSQRPPVPLELSPLSDPCGCSTGMAHF